MRLGILQPHHQSGLMGHLNVSDVLFCFFFSGGGVEC